MLRNSAQQRKRQMAGDENATSRDSCRACELKPNVRAKKNFSHAKDITWGPYVKHVRAHEEAIAEAANASTTAPPDQIAVALPNARDLALRSRRIIN